MKTKAKTQTKKTATKIVLRTQKKPIVAPMLKVENVDTVLLVPYARNAKLHSKKQVDQIGASITEFGFNNPVLIDPDNGIIAGHGRVLAALKLKMKKVPCIRLAHLNEKQRRAYILADNRLSETGGGWDKETALSELEGMATGDAMLDSMFADFKDDMDALKGIGDDQGNVTTPAIIEEMELQPEEHYDYIVIMASKVNEWNRLCSLFGVKEVHSQRTSKRIGIGRAVKASTVLDLIDKKK